VPVEPGCIPEGLKDDKARLVFLAMQWDREHLDDANKTYAKDLASFGRQAITAKAVLGKVEVPATARPQTGFNFDDSLNTTCGSADPASADTTDQTGNNTAAAHAGPPGPLPESIKQEYVSKLAQMTQARVQLKAVKAELIDIQDGAESVNRTDFIAWTQEHGFQRLRGSEE
jgi:hypothetical protein